MNGKYPKLRQNHHNMVGTMSIKGSRLYDQLASAWYDTMRYKTLFYNLQWTADQFLFYSIYFPKFPGFV